MKKRVFISFYFFVVIIFFSCGNNKIITEKNKLQTDTTFITNNIVARNYFFNNNATPPNDRGEFVVDSQEDFDKYFSPAAFMGKDGEPTKIDFSKQTALCIVLEESNILKRLDFIDITSKAEGSITCNYRLTLGQKQSYTTRPCLIVIVDKDKASKGVDFHRVFVR